MLGPKRTALAVFFLLALQAPAETITTLFSDDFEAETPNKLNALLTKWNVYGSVDVLANGNLCDTAGSPSNCVDLDGTNPAGGAIETKNAFTMGPGLYRLIFDLAGSQRVFGSSPSTDTVTVTAGSYFFEDFTLFYTDPFQTFTRDFLVPGSDSVKLRFQHQGSDQIGLLLDNVWLMSVVPDPDGPEDPDGPPAVPEPGTLWLLASGLGLVLWRLRRRNQPSQPAGPKQTS
jgi:hypothetical protein